MEAHSVPDYEKRILFYEGDPQQMDDVANYLERLSKKKLSFHGVIASEDPLAIGAMKYARRQGLSVPEDLSVIGYNNSMLISWCRLCSEFSRVRKCRRNPFFPANLSNEALHYFKVFKYTKNNLWRKKR